MLVVVLVLVLILALTNIDLNLILPLTKGEPDKLGLAAIPMFEIYAGIFVYSAFFERPRELCRRRAKTYSLWLVPVCLLFTLLCAAAIGNYGSELISRFNYPFFTMIQNITVFKTIERIEALVVALWVLPDFIIFAMMLIVASHCLRLVFGYVPDTGDTVMHDMSNGRFLIPTSAALMLVVAVLLDMDSDNLNFYSHLVVPAANLAISCVLIPASYVIGKLRTKR